MDVHETSPGSEHSVRPWVVRLAAACVAIVLALGLWHGYGEWLWSRHHGG